MPPHIAAPFERRDVLFHAFDIARHTLRCMPRYARFRQYDAELPRHTLQRPLLKRYTI